MRADCRNAAPEQARELRPECREVALSKFSTLFVTAIGGAARKVLRPGMRGRVLAVFRRSFYVESDCGELVCLGLASIGHGPLNALFRSDGRALDLEIGLPTRIEAETLAFRSGLRFDFTDAAPWRPRPLPVIASMDVVREGLQTLAAACQLQVPGSGIAPFLPLLRPVGAWPAWCSGHPIGRRAGAAVAALSAWIEGGCAGGNAHTPPPDAVRRLVGLGPGLTPSGDDFLGGIMICLAALGLDELSRALAEKVMPIARRRTGTISLAHLACAAAGEGSAMVHGMLAAILENDRRAIETGLKRLAGMGHSSGFDALAGIGFALGAGVRAGFSVTQRSATRCGCTVPTHTRQWGEDANAFFEN